MRAAAVAAHTFPSVSARVSRILFVALIVMSASLASLAQIAVAPMSITFPTKQAQGSTSGGQIVNITNNGPNAQAVSIAASEEFSESDNCGGSIVGGGSCGMSVFFTPAMIGTVSGAVTISDNSGNLLASVGLKGTGELQLLAAPASINFGTVQIGSNSGTPKSVKITNQDTSALTITSIASSSDYIVNTSGCLNVALNPTKFCSITVQAAPTSENANGSIVVSDSLGGTPLVIPLTVNAQGGSTVPISLSPGTLTFSEGVGGTSAAQTVTVTNTSSGAVTMNSITASSQFSETNNCPSPGMTLAADTNCTVNVSFNPQFVGKITGSLAVFYNGTLSPQLASLTGTAVAGLTGPASVAFTATNEGATSVAKPVIIKNNTSNTVTLGSIVLTGDFVVQAKSTTCALSGQSLGAGSSCTVEVQFAPTVAGAIAGTFTVNNSLNPLVIPLSGTGNASPFATLSPNSAEQGTTALTVNIAGQNTNFDTTTTVNFGTGITVSNLAINGPTSASVQITISSTATVGSRTVTISTPDMSETANATFTVLTGVPSATLNPNSGQQGTGPTTIAITGFDTSFTAASKVNFGSGITTGTVKFNSATSLSVPITISSTAALGARNVTITTGSKVVNATFTVLSGGTSYTIGGTISGYTGSGLMLQDNGDNTLTVPAATTTFTFSQSIPSGNTYNVTVFAQPSNPTQTCTVTNGSGTATQNVTNIQVACTTNTYTIGGSISGYTGSGLVLQDNGGSNLSVSSGATGFTFGTAIASGSTYNVTVLTQPSSPAQTCTVTNGSGTVTNSNISSVQVTCTAVTYTIGGTISGYAGSGMVLQDNGGNNLTVSSGATAFTFTQGIVSGGGYAVTVLTQPSTPTQTCTVTNGSGTVGTSNITNVQIACTTNNYTIGGTISGYAGSGLVLQDNGGNNLTVNSGATSFTFSTAIASGSAYAVTVLTQPSSPAETCTVTNGSGTVGGANVTNVQIACAAVTYTIGGTISGYSGSGMVLQDNGGNNLTVNSGATTFTFSQGIPSGSGYNVTVLTQPSNPAQTCTVTNGTGTATSNVTNVQIACTTVTYTIGGTISGYSGSGMVLQDNGGNNLTVNSGATAFTFSQAINAGSTYNVTVLTQPTNPTETCSVTNGSGTANSNVTSVQIVCSTMTYTIGGTISGYTGSGLVLQDNGGNNLTVNSGATAFTFSQAIPSGSTYAVTVLTQPSSPAQTCTVTNGSGTATANVTNVQVACTTITYTIGGTISGYSGSGLVLLDNGGNNLSVNSGATTFTFSQALNAGSTYNVTVLTQPTGPNENCTVSNGSGTANSNVTNVAVACTVVTSSATLTPSSGHQGSTQTVVITGTATNFGPTTTVNFGANISTGTLTVNGPTSASVPITIANNAAIGSRQVIVATGSQAVTTNFTVLAGVAAITAISPNTIAPTQSESVTVTGAFTSWVSGTTKANFGPGISVGGAAAGTFGPVTVNSGTSLTASLSTSGAFTQANPVQIQTGSQTLTVNNGIFIQTCNGTTPTVVSISPNSGAVAVPLNSTIQVQFSAPMNASTFTLGSSGTVFFYDTTSGLEVPGTIALDPSSTIATITPSEALPAGRAFNINLSNVGSIQDTCADLFPSQQFSFTTAFGDQVTGPTLTGTSPVNTDSNIPINAPVVLQFNDQLDPVTAQTGFSMTRSGSAVSGNFTYSPDDKTVTFTPATTLVPSATYTVTYSAAITDTVGNVLTNPGSFSFTTGTGSDIIPPSVSGVDPANQSSGAGLNVRPHVTFAMPINGLTIANALTLTYQEGGAIVPATVSVAANRLSATITPTASLLANTGYQVNLCGYTDIAGNTGVCFTSTFVTGSSAITSHPVVNSISPPNGQTSVPTNPLVIAVMSNAIDPTTINNNSITLTPANGSAIAGTVSLASDGVTLTYTLPGTTMLTGNKVYTVVVSGFSDVQGNTVTSFTSTFTPGAGSYGASSFKLSSTTPANKATGVSVTSPVTFTMSNLIDAASVNPNTAAVEICFDGAGCSASESVAGTYSVSGATVTFTPLAPYPANTVMGMEVNGMLDEAGNACPDGFHYFTTTSTADTTPPTVTISPANGATNVGLNTQIVLTFSESINASTLSTTSVAVFNGDIPVNYNYTISADSRTIVITPSGSGWTSGGVITVGLTNAIQDLSGNALANTSSQFTLTTAPSATTPTVVSMRPGNGATNVPANTAITLFTSMAMNASTIAGALNVTDNGVVISGSVQLFSNGQAIEFIPTYNFNAGDTIQVFLGSTAQGANGAALSSFSGQFTVAGSLATTAKAQAMNPFPGATSVPLNTVIQVEYNQPLLSSSVTCNGSSGSVTLYNGSSYLTPTCTVTGGGQVINIAPTSNLQAGAQYTVSVTSSVTNTSGTPVQASSFTFTAGTAVDNAAPTITSEAPSNNATNIGTNAQVSVNFNKAMNPISVTGSSIQLSGGSVTEVPSSISFSPNYKRVSIIPQAPLPTSTSMSLSVNGVTSQAGVSVATTNTSFTTAAQPDFAAPYVINSSVLNGQTNVPVNSVLSMQFSKPMDIGSYSSSSVYLMGGVANAIMPTTVSWSSDQTTIYLVPTSALNVGDSYSLCSSGMTDLDGNLQTSFCAAFTAAFTTNSNPPSVVNTSPESAETQVPVNAPVQILFSEPVQPNSTGQITLTTGGSPVAVTASFSDANQLLTLTPALPLAINASYTITVTGVKDTAGNTMTGTVTNNFTTSGTFNLNTPTVVASDPPANAVSIGTNATPRVLFSERLNPLSVVTSSNEPYNNGSVELMNFNTGAPVPITVTMSSDRMTAIVTPTSALLGNTTYQISVGTGSVNYYDVAGNAGTAYTSLFTTGASADTTHTTVSSISPSNAQTGVPINSLIFAQMSDGVDPTTITNSSISVTVSGGGAVAGTVSLASDGVTVVFTPNNSLAKASTFNVTVGGFNDVQGNPVTSSTSSFSTNSGNYGPNSFTFVSSNASGQNSWGVTAPVTVTMSNIVDAASVNASTVQFVCSAQGSHCSNATVAGTYSVNGATITFTPLTQFPGGASMEIAVNGLMDVAGNSFAYAQVATFGVASNADTTPPTVAITPSNGSTNVGLDPQVVLTFSKSINPTTVSFTSVVLFAGDVALNPTITISADNRSVVLSGFTLPTSTMVTVAATHLITDLSGNALADTTSTFTTASAAITSAPTVVNSRPGTGATNVPTNSVITLFTSAPMNAGTIAGSLYVSQNGIPISGTPTVAANGQSIVFTPSSAFTAGATIQVFLNSTAQDIYGNNLTSFEATFTTAGSTSSAAVVQASNPFVNASNVPLNTTIQVQYNQTIQAGSVNCSSSSGSVTLTSSGYVNTTCSVSGQVITLNPTGNLSAGQQYTVTVTNGVTNTSSVPVTGFSYTFTAGSAVDTAAPVVVSVAPPNAFTNIGTNAGVSVNFNKAIDPVSVNGSTIQLSGGSITEVPSSISFTPDYTRVTILPQAPLPANTQMTIAINGVTSEAGVAVASQTTNFTTRAGPDLTSPYVVHSSVLANQTVGTNAAFAMQFNEPIDPGSVNPAGAQDVYINDMTASAAVPTTITFSADLTTVMLTPTSSLTPGDQLQMCSSSILNLSGMVQQPFCVSFLVGPSPITTGPSILQVSPPSGFTGLATNALVEVLFSEQIDGASTSGVTLKQGGSVVPTTTVLFDGDQGIQLLPLAPLAPNTTYTINVTGVLDITGNAQASFPSQSFTTGTGIDLVPPMFVSSNPASGATSVPDNTSIQAVFTEAMDPASFDPTSSFTLRDSSRNLVPGTITFSPDYKTVTLQPNSTLASGAIYFMYISSLGPVYDLSGNKNAPILFLFTTQ